MSKQHSKMLHVTSTFRLDIHCSLWPGNVYLCHCSLHLLSCILECSLVPRLLRREEEREPGTHCSRMHHVSLVTCILLRYTKITVNFCLPPERPKCIVILSVGHIYGRYWSQKRYRFDGNSLHCFVQVDRWTSKGKIASFTNAWTSLASEKLSTFVAPFSSSADSMVSGRQVFHGRSRCASRRLV